MQAKNLFVRPYSLVPETESPHPIWKMQPIIITTYVANEN